MTDFQNSWQEPAVVKPFRPKATTQEQGFEELVARYHKLVMSLINQYYGGQLKSQADDLSQDIWTKLWVAFKKNENNLVSFKSYLYRTVQTTLWDAIRSKHPNAEEIDDHHMLNNSSNEDVVTAKMSLEQMMRGLKPEEAQMVRAYLKGFNNGEIAGLLGCSEGRVRNLLSRLKKKMAK